MKNYKKPLLLLSISIALLFTTCVENHLLPNFGVISLTSDPIGAEIYLEDVNTGKVTPDSLIELLSNEYSITLKMIDFDDTIFSVQIGEGQHLSHDIFMSESNPEGEIKIISIPEGASIFINGENTGEVTPFTFKDLERGIYSFSLMLNLYDDSNFQIDLAKDEMIERNTRLIITGTAGGIIVNSNPSGANIYLDGFDTQQITPDTLNSTDSPCSN